MIPELVQVSKYYFHMYEAISISIIKFKETNYIYVCISTTQLLTILCPTAANNTSAHQLTPYCEPSITPCAKQHPASPQAAATLHPTQRLWKRDSHTLPTLHERNPQGFLSVEGDTPPAVADPLGYHHQAEGRGLRDKSGNGSLFGVAANRLPAYLTFPGPLAQ